MSTTPPAVPASALPASVIAHDEITVALLGEGPPARLFVRSARGAAPLAAFDGEVVAAGPDHALVGPTSSGNAAALRRLLPWLTPRPIGLHTSAGFGDRLGLATPGHARALRAASPGVVPVFAQQSIREMARTGRSPHDVLDAATWGALAAGWRGPVGADADHLKSPGDIDRCVEARFSLYTIDPGAHVDEAAGAVDAATLRARFEALPWARLEDEAAAMRVRHLGRPLDLGRGTVSLDEEGLLRAAVKYGHAVAHVSDMYRHLRARCEPGTFELEVSVDETDSPTSPAEHVFVARELRRLGVEWVSLAPRFVGRFEKGVDYIGDLDAFGRDVDAHAAIARALGPYKLSLHSGSDKFAVYPAVAEATRGLLHLKTAGTSYLEALRTIARLDPELLAQVYAFARERYPEDRASYHVSASLEAAPADPAAGVDLLDQFDARQILHVTFGSVLTARDARGAPRFATRLRAALLAHPEAYAACLERHFVRHLAPLAAHVV